MLLGTTLQNRLRLPSWLRSSIVEIEPADGDVKFERVLHFPNQTVNAKPMMKEH